MRTPVLLLTGNGYRFPEAARDRIQTWTQHHTKAQSSSPPISPVIFGDQLSREGYPRSSGSIDQKGSLASIHPGNLLAGGDACEADNEFLGPASNTAFMKHIRQVIEGQLVEDRVSDLQSNQIDTDLSAGSPDYVLPPRQLADSLVDHYWVFVHPLYPFLHKPSFCEIYDTLWTGQKLSNTGCTNMKIDEATSVCILNLVLALGCQYHHKHGVGTSIATAEVFYKRARSFLRLNPTEPRNNTLQLVQAMLLMTQFLMGTGHTHKAWGVVGMAVRICYQLGLHRNADSSPETFPKPVQREIVRRVYHGALMLER